MIHKSLPKQTDLFKIIKLIERKVLKGTHLPMTMKEIQAGYLINPSLKNIYLNLAQNTLPSSKAAVRQFKTQKEKYLLLDMLLFKIQTTHDQ